MKLTNSIHVRLLKDLLPVVVDVRFVQDNKFLQSLVWGLVIYIYHTLNHVSIVPLLRHNHDTIASQEDQAVIHDTVLAIAVVELLNNFILP